MKIRDYLGALGIFILLSSFISTECHAAGVVSVPDEIHLRAAMDGGGTVTFNCDGTIYLTDSVIVSTDTVLDASGRSISISGSNSVRVLTVNTGVNLIVQDLTICNGFSTNGGGILNAGILQLRNSIICSNTSWGVFDDNSHSVFPGQGGGIYNVGAINGSNVQFCANTCVGGIQVDYVYVLPSWFPGHGGALFNLGNAQLTNCVFTGNCASGASLDAISGGSSDASGGAIYNGGILTVIGSEFSDSQAIGGTGGDSDNYMYPMPGGFGGTAKGGALFSSNTALLVACSFYSNKALGGRGGIGNEGQGATPPSVPGSGLNGGNGGDAFGGAVYISQGLGSLINCTFFADNAQGGDGGTGGIGGPGNPAPRGWQGGPGGNGGNGGNAYGGAISISGGACNLTNVTVASGSAIAGKSGAYGSGGPGGDYSGNPNPGPNGTNGVEGAAYGGNVQNLSGSFSLKNSIVAYAQLPGNGSGPLIDLGNNISSDSSCGFTHTSSSNNTDPKLSPLLNRGGPTKTMAPLANSPALDSADPAATPTIDQRGVPRPQLRYPDIGAVEYTYAIVTKTEANQARFDFSAMPDRDYSIEVSTNFIQWSSLSQFHTGSSGVISFHEQLDAPQQFYRPLLLNP